MHLVQPFPTLGDRASLQNFPSETTSDPCHHSDTIRRADSTVQSELFNRGCSIGAVQLGRDARRSPALGAAHRRSAGTASSPCCFRSVNRSDKNRSIRRSLENSLGSCLPLPPDQPNTTGPAESRAWLLSVSQFPDRFHGRLIAFPTGSLPSFWR